MYSSMDPYGTRMLCIANCCQRCSLVMLLVSEFTLAFPSEPYVRAVFLPWKTALLSPKGIFKRLLHSCTPGRQRRRMLGVPSQAPFFMQRDIQERGCLEGCLFDPLNYSICADFQLESGFQSATRITSIQVVSHDFARAPCLKIERCVCDVVFFAACRQRGLVPVRFLLEDKTLFPMDDKPCPVDS